MLAAFVMTGVYSIASAFEEPTSVIALPAAEITAAVPEDIVVEAGPSQAVTPWQRLEWFDLRTFGALNLGGSIPGAAWQTFMDRPREAGTHWEGFAERYGVSVSTNAVSNGMEAGIGAIWGEDPRYQREGAGSSMKSRLGHVVKWTVAAPDKSGELRPAYARFIAFTGSSFISNAWREPSDTNMDHSFARIGFALAGRMGSNAFCEFWPDARRKFFHWTARGSGRHKMPVEASRASACTPRRYEKTDSFVICGCSGDVCPDGHAIHPNGLEQHNGDSGPRE